MLGIVSNFEVSNTSFSIKFSFINTYCPIVHGVRSRDDVGAHTCFALLHRIIIKTCLKGRPVASHTHGASRSLRDRLMLYAGLWK